MGRRARADRILLPLARLEPPLSWLDWYHADGDRVWICQYRHKRQVDYYRITPALTAELLHLGFIEPVELEWNRDRYVLTPAGLWTVIKQGLSERRQVKRERAARFETRGIVDSRRKIRTYTPPHVWQEWSLATATDQAPCPSHPAGNTSEQCHDCMGT